jgi:hypothetical protein
MGTALNALGFGLCLVAIGLLLFRNRIITAETDLRARQMKLERYFLGRYWLDLGIGGLIVGFAFQIVAALVWGT